MPEKTIAQSEALFRYRADPNFRNMIEAVVSSALPDEHPKYSKVVYLAALDFFIIGIAMVADPREIHQPNCDPFSFDIRPDGRAKFTGPMNAKLVAEFGEPILDPDQYLLLEVGSPLPHPTFDPTTSTIVGHEPWFEAWVAAKAQLDAFLAR